MYNHYGSRSIYLEYRPYPSFVDRNKLGKDYTISYLNKNLCKILERNNLVRLNFSEKLREILNMGNINIPHDNSNKALYYSIYNYGKEFHIRSDKDLDRIADSFFRYYNNHYLLEYHGLVKLNSSTFFNFYDISEENNYILAYPYSESNDRIFRLGSVSGLEKIKESIKPTKIKVSKLLRLITPYNLESFVLEYRLCWDSIYDTPKLYRNLEVLNSKGIVKAYKDESNISSCMGGKKSKYVRFYERNSNFSLLVMKSESGEILARCILYKCTDGNIYYRKIYSSNHYTHRVVVKWLEENGCINLNTLSYYECSKLKLKLNFIHNITFPYLDSFIYYDRYKKTLQVYAPKFNNKWINRFRYRKLTSTRGGSESI